MIVENTKPNVAIFLDIDGVLGPNHFSISEMFSRFKVIDILDPSHYKECTRCVTCSTAQAHLFDNQAVESLHALINKIKIVANVHIIISSFWRTNRTLPELKQTFNMHDFSNYITGKTVESGRSFREWENECCFFHREEDKDCRASQINRWIKDHPRYLGFVIIDDYDDHLEINFGEKFISTKHHHYEILTPEDAEKAYKIMMDQLT